MKFQGLRIVLAYLLTLPGATLMAQYHILTVTDADAAPGSIGTVQVLYDNDGSDVQGWSFGICQSQPTNALDRGLASER